MDTRDFDEIIAGLSQLDAELELKENLFKGKHSNIQMNNNNNLTEIKKTNCHQTYSHTNNSIIASNLYTDNHAKNVSSVTFSDSITILERNAELDNELDNVLKELDYLTNSADTFQNNQEINLTNILPDTDKYFKDKNNLDIENPISNTFNSFISSDSSNQISKDLSKPVVLKSCLANGNKKNLNENAKLNNTLDASKRPLSYGSNFSGESICSSNFNDSFSYNSYESSYCNQNINNENFSSEDKYNNVSKDFSRQESIDSNGNKTNICIKDQICVKINSCDGSSKMIPIDDTTTAFDLSNILIRKYRYLPSESWSIIERLNDLQIERILEEHLKIKELVESWPPEANNRFWLMEKSHKYDILSDEQILNSVKKNCFKPNMEGMLHMKIEGKKSWKKFYFVLRASGLYYNPKGKGNKTSELLCLNTLTNCDIYTRTADWKNNINKAPTEFYFILKPTGLYKRSTNSIKYLCVEEESDLNNWINNLRLVKYGSKIYENMLRPINQSSQSSKLQQSINTNSLETLIEFNNKKTEIQQNNISFTSSYYSPSCGNLTSINRKPFNGKSDMFLSTPSNLNSTNYNKTVSFDSASISNKISNDLNNYQENIDAASNRNIIPYPNNSHCLKKSSVSDSDFRDSIGKSPIIHNFPSFGTVVNKNENNRVNGAINSDDIGFKTSRSLLAHKPNIPLTSTVSRHISIQNSDDIVGTLPKNNKMLHIDMNIMNKNKVFTFGDNKIINNNIETYNLNNQINKNTYKPRTSNSDELQVLNNGNGDFFRFSSPDYKTTDFNFSKGDNNNIVEGISPYNGYQMKQPYLNSYDQQNHNFNARQLSPSTPNFGILTNMDQHRFSGISNSSSKSPGVPSSKHLNLNNLKIQTFLNDNTGSITNDFHEWNNDRYPNDNTPNEFNRISFSSSNKKSFNNSKNNQYNINHTSSQIAMLRKNSLKLTNDPLNSDSSHNVIDQNKNLQNNLYDTIVDKEEVSLNFPPPPTPEIFNFLAKRKNELSLNGQFQNHSNIIMQGSSNNLINNHGMEINALNNHLPLKMIPEKFSPNNNYYLPNNMNNVSAAYNLQKKSNYNNSTIINNSNDCNNKKGFEFPLLYNNQLTNKNENINNFDMNREKVIYNEKNFQNAFKCNSFENLQNLPPPPPTRSSITKLSTTPVLNYKSPQLNYYASPKTKYVIDDLNRMLYNKIKQGVNGVNRFNSCLENYSPTGYNGGDSLEIFNDLPPPPHELLESLKAMKYDLSRVST